MDRTEEGDGLFRKNNEETPSRSESIPSNYCHTKQKLQRHRSIRLPTKSDTSPSRPSPQP